MKLLSFDIVNFGFPQSLENMVYDFMSFKLFSSGYKHVSSTYSAISPPPPPPPPPGENGGGGGDCSIDPIRKKAIFSVPSLIFLQVNHFFSISSIKKY